MDRLGEALKEGDIDSSTLQPSAGEGADAIYTLQVHGLQAIETWERLLNSLGYH